MPALHSDTLELLRDEGHRSSFFLSLLKPLTLWSMRVNDAGVARGDREIDFDGGSGSHWTAVEAYQELWVGSTPGDDDIGRVRIRGISSGDSGVTGTVSVAPNVVWWEDDHYLTVKHHYPLVAMYPYIDPGDPDTIGDEVFYKDRDIAYSDQNEEPNPVVVVNFSQRAGFILDQGSIGEDSYSNPSGSYVVFWVDCSDSYAVAQGATISSYSLTTYPSTNVDFDTSTGRGKIRATSLTQDYYWVKVTVTDSNGKTQTGWRCIFVHDPDLTGTTYPYHDFEVNQLSGGYDRGGWYTQVQLNGGAHPDDVPDKTFAVLWKESKWGLSSKDVKLVYDLDNSFYSRDQLFVNPKVSYQVTPVGGNCDVQVTFECGILIDGEVPADGVGVRIHFAVSGASSQTLDGTTSDGQITYTHTFSGANCNGTITISNNTGVVRITRLSYSTGAVRTDSSSEYPDPLVIFPQTMIAGYTMNEQLSSSRTSLQGTQRDTLEIATIEELLRNEYMFSISLAARPDPSVWYEYASWLTIGRACHHVWKWHSTLMEVADVVGLVDNTDGRAFAEFEEGTLYTMPDSMARQAGIRAHVVTDKKGQVHLTYDPQLLTDSERGALDTVANITVTDRSGEMVLLRNPIREVALVFTSGFAFPGTFTANPDAGNALEPDAEPYCAISPGSHPPHGGGEGAVNFDKQVFRDQNHANQIAGRVDLAANNKYPELRIRFHGDYLDVIDFHLAEFWEIDLVSADTAKEIALPDLKLIPRDASVQVDVAAGTVKVNVVFEPEVLGNPGVTTECPSLVDMGNYDIPVPEPSALPGAIVTAGSVYYLPPDTDSWTLRTAEATEDMVEDPFWQSRVGGNASANAYMFRCGSGYIKRTTDAWSNETDVTPDVGGIPSEDLVFVALDADWAVQGGFACLAYYDDGADIYTWLVYTVDDGQTWIETEVY